MPNKKISELDPANPLSTGGQVELLQSGGNFRFDLAGEFRKTRVVTGADSDAQTDDNSLIIFNSASPFNFTLNQLVADTKISFLNIGAGAVTFINGSGVTLTGGPTLSAASGTSYPTALVFYHTATTPRVVVGATGTGGGTWGSITGTLSSQTDLQTALDGKQPIDSDLTAIAALSPSNDDIIQRKAGAWTNRTLAQLSADLGIAGGLTNVTTSSSTSGNFSLDMSSAIRKYFDIGTTQTGNLVLTAISNVTNMIECTVSMRLTGTRTIDMSAITNIKMGREETNSGRWNTSTKILTIEAVTASPVILYFYKDASSNYLCTATYRYEP